MDQSIRKPARGQTVQSAEVGSVILKGLADLAPSTSLARLSERVDMPASKVHRYLQALIASGFAEQNDSNNHYCLGREALQVGLAALGGLDVVRASTRLLGALRDQINETCFLAVWGNKGPTVVLLEKARRSVTLVTQIGSVLPILTSCTGLVFDAYLPEQQMAELRAEELREAPQAGRGLAAQREMIRARGQHNIRGSLLPGIDALSAPVFTVGERVAGVITVVGSSSALDVSLTGPIASALMETTHAISLHMGASNAGQGSTL